MAREPKRIRTATVRLRFVLPAWARDPVVRRLLVVAGIMVAGWLLGTAGPAHAGTSAGPASGTPHTVPGHTVPGHTGPGTVPAVPATTAVPQMAAVATVTRVQEVVGVPDTAAAMTTSKAAGRRAAGYSVRRLGTGPEIALVPLLATRATASPVISPVRSTMTSPVTPDTSVPGASSLRKVSGGLADSLREAQRALPVHLPAVLDVPGMAWASVTDLASAGPWWPDGTGVDLSWTPRQRLGADAGSGDRAEVRAPEPFAVSGASKGDRGTFGAALSHPAPVPAVEHPQPFVFAAPAHVLRPAAGPVLAGVGLAHLGGPGAVARPWRLPAPPPFLIGPAVHSATNEPSCSPD
ncbi:hypothetical protein [Actinomadura alba]|uniref:Secreted protein n=1 Tax=Actinomadura alba TaxID=406431 RepID=A0ABR7LU31_9ACTN|nr:hypothetical protein [Actinomadura alba]MBC6468074.1 hypothetical protein [Actinomadura alba]